MKIIPHSHSKLIMHQHLVRDNQLDELIEANVHGARYGEDEKDYQRCDHRGYLMRGRSFILLRRHLPFDGVA